MYATWRSYMTVTNMGMDVTGLVYQPVKYPGQNTSACRLSSPNEASQRNACIIDPDGKINISYGGYSYGARPALYH